MFYQKILTGEKPYHIRIGTLNRFDEHRHADVELHYCIEGETKISIKKTSYILSQGELAVISPMQSHSIDVRSSGENKVLTIIVGATFLRHNFDHFSKVSLEDPIIYLDDADEKAYKLKELFLETVEMRLFSDCSNDLMLIGNIYKICAYLLAISEEKSNLSGSNKKALRGVASIEGALELIYYHYGENITVEDAARATGYGKSNFCKTFKEITGYTFHSLLNRQRCEASCTLLKESDMTISEIASEVGFFEAKTFCRVFKEIYGISPGGYRKNNTQR